MISDKQKNEIDILYNYIEASLELYNLKSIIPLTMEEVLDHLKSKNKK